MYLLFAIQSYLHIYFSVVSVDIQKEMSFMKRALDIERNRSMMLDREIDRRKSQMRESNALISKLRNQLASIESKCNCAMIQKQLCMHDDKIAIIDDLNAKLESVSQFVADIICFLQKKRELCESKIEMQMQIDQLQLELQNVASHAIIDVCK